MAKAQASGLTSQSTGLTGTPALMTYPTISQAADAATTVVAVLRGDAGTPKIEAAHAAWVIVGFGLSRIDQHNAAVKGATRFSPDTAAAHAQLADALDDLKGNGIHAAGKVPWDQVITLLLALVQQWLNNQ